MRPTGMRVAEISVLLFSDPQVVKLKRLGGEAAQLAFVRFILACWQWGDQLSVDDQEPDYAAAIRESGLVDDEGCFRDDAWDDWYGVRVRAREAAQERGRRGGLASALSRQSGAQVNHRQTDRQTDGVVVVGGRGLERGTNNNGRMKNLERTR
jgi:hypothetical protein